MLHFAILYRYHNRLQIDCRLPTKAIIRNYIIQKTLSGDSNDASSAMLSRCLAHRTLRSIWTRSLTTASVPNKIDKEARKVPAPQAPNLASTWSTNQQPRPTAGEGPRFEQTVMDLQPNPPSAMEMIANEPVRLLQARKAVCDGGACV